MRKAMIERKGFVVNCITCKGHVNEFADTFELALENAEEHTRVGEPIGRIPERPGLGHKWHKVLITECVLVERADAVEAERKAKRVPRRTRDN